MELSLEQKTCAVCAAVSDLALRQPLETDLQLPDYCGDIQRILHCTVQPNLHVITASGERVGAEGELVIRLVYLTENNRIDCVEQHMPLSVSGIVKQLPAGAVLHGLASIEYLNCRAISPRKVSLSGTALVRIEILEKKEETFADSSEQLETLTQDLSVSRLSALTDKWFDLSETIALGDNRPTVGKVLRTTGTPVLQTVETVKDKLLLKGSLDVELLYLADDGALFRLTHTLPISQVIEAPGVSPDDDVDCALFLQALYAEPKQDGNNEARLVELAAKLSVVMKSYVSEFVTVVTDCYTTQGTLQPTFSEQAFPLRIAPLHLARSIQQTIDTGLENATLLDVAVDRTHTETSGSNGAVTLSCQTKLSLLLQNADGEMQYQERICDFQIEEALGTDTENVFCSPVVSLRVTQTVLDADGMLRLRLETAVDGAVFTDQTVRVLTEASIDETDQKDGQSLVLSFSKKGDVLWDIAKRYRTKLSQIREENAIQGDVLQEDCMLLIPCAG